jgi:hypothetical protein
MVEVLINRVGWNVNGIIRFPLEALNLFPRLPVIVIACFHIAVLMQIIDMALQIIEAFVR